MVKTLSRLLLCFALTASLLACSARRQFQPGEIPQIVDVSSEDEQYGHEVLNMMMDEYTLDRDDQNISRVRDIIDRLADSAASNSAPWHVYVFKDDTVENAAATRGNYIFVWTGMLKKVRDDDELAAVLAHELSHVLAGHTQPTPDEEFAQIFSQVGGQVTSGILSGNGQIGIVADLAGALTQALIGAIFVNPEEQRKELEADQIGLFLMAKANYDPNKALEFWERMQREGFGDVGPVQFFTSHPSSDERLEQIRKLLPEAEQLRTSTKDEANSYTSEWTITTEKKINAGQRYKTKQNKKPAAKPTPVPVLPTPAVSDSAPEPW